MQLRKCSSKRQIAVIFIGVDEKKFFTQHKLRCPTIRKKNTRASLTVKEPKTTNPKKPICKIRQDFLLHLILILCSERVRGTIYYLIFPLLSLYGQHL